MNINLFTIDSALAATTGASSVLQKPDENTKGTKFSLTPDDENPQVNSFEQPTTYNVNDEIQSREETITKSNADNETKPKEQKPASGTIKLLPNQQPNEDQNIIKSKLAEYAVAPEQNKEGTAPKIEPNTRQQLAQIIANTQTGKSPPVSVNAVKSAPIKLPNSTEKGQSGLKTVLPVTSEGQNGLKAVLPFTSKSAPEGKKQPEAKSITEKGIIKELTPEAPANTGKSTTTAGGKALAVNINLQTVQAKAPEIQPQPAGIDPEKPVPIEEIDAKTTDSQTLSQLLNPNAKETTHTGNNLSENQNAQKLNIAAVQVSTGQAKDQGTSTSNKKKQISASRFSNLFTIPSPSKAPKGRLQSVSTRQNWERYP